MSRLLYEKWKPGADAVAIVRKAAAICQEYADQGYDVTLRQLYYQFVARDLLPNNMRSYKRLGDIVNRARLAGLLDWDFIVDRTRNLRSVSHWSDPASVIEAAAQSYRLDKWADQPRRVEVWVEKEALAGIVQRVADEEDVAWFSCRGYVSQSELWAAGQRVTGYLERGQAVTVLHLGDHDPSGIDMTRDIEDRLNKFVLVDWCRDHYDEFDADSVTASDIREHLVDHLDGESPPIEVRRIALNRDQVDQYRPPPNPAKLTDSRSSAYVEEHGYQSWELDALDPVVLADLIRSHVQSIVQPSLFDALAERESDEREGLRAISANYEAIAAQVNGS